MYFAELSILVMTAMTLSVYDISEPTDEAGVPLTAAKATYSGGTIRYAVMASGFDPWLTYTSAQSSRPVQMQYRPPLW